MKKILTEQQLRQIVRESLKTYLLSEEFEQTETLFIYDLTIDRVNILEGKDGIYRFVAKTHPQTTCEWETKTANGDTVVTDGTIEGTVDLTQVQSAIGKNQSIQRQIITRFFQQVFGYFTVSGSIQFFDGSDIVFDRTNDLQVEMEEDFEAIKVESVSLKTTGFNPEGEEETSIEDEPINNVEEPSEEEATDFTSQLRRAGFTIEQDGDKGKIRTASDNQWVATYYSNNSVMMFPDIKNEALINALKTACVNSGVRFLEQ